MYTKKVRERFWRKVVIPEDSEGCWLWHGDPSYGYGRATYTKNGKRQQAHRMSWELEIGQIPKGVFVLHRCDIKACVNPSHLYLGTQQDNVRDALERDRYCKRPGELNPQAKLTDEKVLALRKDRAGGMTLKALSKKYKVSYAVVANVYRGNSWKHVGGPLQKDPTVPARKLASSEEEELVRSYASGVLGGEICKEFNIARGTMVDVLERHGVARRSPGKPPRLTACNVKQIRKMYTQRKTTMQSLAEQFGVSIGTIHHAVHGSYAPQHGIE